MVLNKYNTYFFYFKIQLYWLFCVCFEFLKSDAYFQFIGSSRLSQKTKLICFSLSSIGNACSYQPKKDFKFNYQRLIPSNNL